MCIRRFFATKPPEILAIGMAKSDILDICDSPGSLETGRMVRETDETLLDKQNDTTIHSGHFMVSCVHDDDEEPQVEETNEEIVVKNDGFNFEEAPKEPAQSYNFGDCESPAGAVCIDCSLTKLFNCMTLAYRFVFTS